MAKLQLRKLQAVGDATETENQQLIADQARDIAEARLNQALDNLDPQPEYLTYSQAVQELENAKMDYDNAWTAFLHTNEGRHYNESNQRYQSAKKHYEGTLRKLEGNGHLQNYTTAESHKAGSAQIVSRAEEQATTDPEYQQTTEYQQIIEQHRGVVARCRQAWTDIGYTLEGKSYHRAKVQIDKAESEISRAWARGNQAPQGQKLSRIMEQINQLEQNHQQAEQALKQTPACEDYAKAAEDYRLATLVADQNKDKKAKLATIIPIEDDSAKDNTSQAPKILSVA